jgi:hypothetical protein
VRAEAIIAFVVLILATVPDVYGAPQPGPPAIELGYGPSSLIPLAQGTPVYSTGDQFWLSSDYNISLRAALFPPGFSSAISIVPIGPRSVTNVYTFTRSDQSGEWDLVLASGTLPIRVIPFDFEQPPTLNSPSLSSASLLNNGTLVTNFTIGLGDGYNGQGCIIGSTVPSVVSFLFPASEGGGAVSLVTNGTGVSADSSPYGPPSTHRGTMDFWLEMYYPYSYSSTENSALLVTRDVLVARTSPILLNSSLRSNSTLEMTEYAHLRTGRYDITVYFRDGSGLTAREASVLWTGVGPWVWLGGCIGLKTLASTFTYSSTLTVPTSEWPTGIYAMLDVGGVEGTVFSRIQLNLAAVHLTTGDWKVPFPRGLSVSVAQDPALANSATVNGTVYLELKHVPANVNILVGSAGSRIENLSVGISAPHSEVSVAVALGKVNVEVETSGTGVPGARVTMSANSSLRGAPFSAITNAQGMVSFLMIPGSYILTYQYRNFTGTASVVISGGDTSVVNAEVPQVVNYTPLYVLLGLGALGATMNFFFWRRVVRAG